MLRIIIGIVFFLCVFNANASMTTYIAEIQNGADGGVFSVGRTATANRKLPENGYMQYLGGQVMFRFGKDIMTYRLNDNDNNGLDAGDQILIDMQLTVHDMNNNDLIGYALFNGTLNVTPKVTSQTDFGLATDEDGIEFGVYFSDEDSISQFGEGDFYEGVMHVQDEFFSATFNGIRTNYDDSKTFFINGEARGQDGVLNASYYDASEELFIPEYRVGFNLSAKTIGEAQAIAIPVPAALPMGLACMSLAGMGARRRRNR